MDLKIEARPKSKIEIYGEVYEVRRPSIQDITDFDQQSKKAKPEKQVELVQEFISTFGVPLKVIKGMELEHFETLAQFFIPKKKS